MQIIRRSELTDLQRQLDKLNESLFDPLDQFDHPPSALEFGEAILGAKLDKWQRKYMKAAPKEARVGIAASRQSGKSTVTGLFVAHCLLFIPGFQCLVASRSLRQASHYLTTVREAVLSIIPRTMMPQLNRLSMELPNGSQIISIPCAQPDAGRGFSPHLVVLDEAAFAPEELFRAITPSLAATQGALHMLSSPNGRQGYFFEAFEGVAADVFWSQRVSWRDCPRITEETARIERIALGELYFRQEFEAEFITPLGAFFGFSAISNMEEGEDPPLADLDYRDMEKVLDAIMPEPAPNEADLRAALDRTDRVKHLIYD